jgi:hypothetical protein
MTKASAYTVQNNTQARTNTHASSGIQMHDISVIAIKAIPSDRAATGTGHLKIYSI